jgi:hypothetical protein
MQRTFRITYAETGYYFVDNRLIDTSIETVEYFIRHMSGFTAVKRPSHHLIKRACNDAKRDGEAILTVAA